MAKTHLTDDGPKPCNAKSEATCTAKFHGERSPHFKDDVDAQKAFEAYNEEHKPLEKMTKKVRSITEAPSFKQPEPAKLSPAARKVQKEAENAAKTAATLAEIQENNPASAKASQNDAYWPGAADAMTTATMLKNEGKLDRKTLDQKFDTIVEGLQDGEHSGEFTDDNYWQGVKDGIVASGAMTEKEIANVVSPKTVKYVHFNQNHSSVTKALKSAPVYQKTSQVTVRVAKKGEKLETVLKDGTVETSRILNGNEIIVKNPSGEESAMSPEKFKSKYTDLGNGVWQAKGEIKAVQNPTGVPIQVYAPWGEQQYGDEKCWIAESGDDRYIIGDAEFKKMYAEKV